MGLLFDIIPQEIQSELVNTHFQHLMMNFKRSIK